MKITKFEDIQAWQLARELTKAVYAVSARNPFTKDFGLRDQIRRAAGSVMHNIAEGFDAGTNPEFIRFLHYAQRSATEVLSQLYVALDQGYISGKHSLNYRKRPRKPMQCVEDLSNTFNRGTNLKSNQEPKHII